MGGLKMIFSRRSSASIDKNDEQQQYSKEDYLQLREENRRLRQITARIATKIGIVPRNIHTSTREDNDPDKSRRSSEIKYDVSVTEDDYCPPPHIIMAQAHRLQKLNELVVALSQAPRVAEAYKIVAEYTRDIVGAARVSIAMLDKDDMGDEYLELYGLDGSEGTIPLGMKLPMQGTQIGHVATTRQPVRVMDTANSAYLDCQNLAKMGVTACIDVPLISSGCVLGTLNTGVTDKAVYYPEVEYMLLQIASVLASAIDKERLLDQALQARNLLLKQQDHQDVLVVECNHCHNKVVASSATMLPRESECETAVTDELDHSENSFSDPLHTTTKSL